MLRNLILAGLACTLALAIAGCGSKEPAPTGDGTAVAGKQAEPSRPDAAPDTKSATSEKGPDKAGPGPSPNVAAKGPDQPGPSTPAAEPATPKLASGDATKFKGTYAMYLSPKQVKINQKMVAAGKEPFVGEITIDGAGGYVFRFGIKSFEKVTKGTTQASGNDITLTPVTVNGKTPESDGDKRAIPATLQPDGKTLMLHLKSKVGGGDQKFIKK